MGTIPFWALPFSRLAGSGLRRLRTFVEHPVHSHLLGASPLSASSLSPSPPCTVMVGKGLSALASTSKPCVSLSISHGSSVHEPLSSGTLLGAITHPRSLAHTQSGLNLRPVFSTLGHPVSISDRPRPRLILYPCLLVHRPYVSISSPLRR